MLTFNGNLKVYVALEPCDMRKSFHGLSAMVRNHLGLDPLSGAAYLFSWPQDIEGDRRKLVLKPTALAMLTDGIDLRDGLQRPWYELR
jgi:transposase